MKLFDLAIRRRRA